MVVMEFNGVTMINTKITSNTCPLCKQHRHESELVWHFGGQTGCKQCADRYFGELMRHQR